MLQDNDESGSVGMVMVGTVTGGTVTPGTLTPVISEVDVDAALVPDVEAPCPPVVDDEVLDVLVDPFGAGSGTTPEFDVLVEE